MNENRMGMKMESDTLTELTPALVKAQAAIENAKRTKKNQHFGNAYAELADVWDVCRKPLTDNGLAVSQNLYFEERPLTAAGDEQPQRVYLVTLLMHVSGQFLRSLFPVLAMKDDPQSWGSAQTYARKYALAALVGVATEDDDGNAASGRSARTAGAVVKGQEPKPLPAQPAAPQAARKTPPAPDARPAPQPMSGLAAAHIANGQPPAPAQAPAAATPPPAPAESQTPDKPMSASQAGYIIRLASMVDVGLEAIVSDLGLTAGVQYNDTGELVEVTGTTRDAQLLIDELRKRGAK